MRVIAHYSPQCLHPPLTPPLIPYVVRAFIQTIRLLEQAERLDSRVKIIEQKCARLMTLLKPSYVRAKLDMPAPPLSKGLSQYPLDPAKTVLSADQHAERWTTAVLRARKQCKKVLSARSQFFLSAPPPGQQVS
jgi:hypothetical protein